MAAARSGHITAYAVMWPRTPRGHATAESAGISKAASERLQQCIRPTCAPRERQLIVTPPSAPRGCLAEEAGLVQGPVPTVVHAAVITGALALFGLWGAGLGGALGHGATQLFGDAAPGL